MTLPETLRKLKSDYPRLKIRATEFSDHIWIYDLEVERQWRNQGIGSAAIRELQKLGKTLKLEAVADFDWQLDLEHFYFRLGFKSVRYGGAFPEMTWRPK